MKFLLLLFILLSEAWADDFEDIPGQLAIPAGQAVRRNAGNTAFEAFTPQNLTTPITLANGGQGLDASMTTITTSGAVNNLAITTLILKFTGTNPNLSGIVAPSDARRVLVYNATAGSMTITHQSTNSSAANRIITPNAASYTLTNSAAIELWYDTVTARWRLGDEQLTATSPLVLSSTTGALSMPAATTSVNGYMPASAQSAIATAQSNISTAQSNITTLQTNSVWRPQGNDIYNTNSLSVWISLYDCSELTTYATCSAAVASGCVLVNAGNCATFNGDESGCNDAGGGGQCSYSDPNCTNSYFTSCSGLYRRDDTTSAKLQVKATESCSGTAATCDSLGAGSNCTDQDGCTSNANTCPDFDEDETGCGTAGCSFTAAIACSLFDGDEGACTSNPDCTWNDPVCEGTIPSTCDGDNSSCSGTAATCPTLTGANCTAQDGCTFGATPAFRAQGDNVTTSDGYLEFEKTSAGAPTSGDCDNDNERGRFQLDITNHRLYICNGATRGWDYSDLTD